MATTWRGPGHTVPKTVPTGGATKGDVYVMRSGATGSCGIWVNTYSAADPGILMVDGEHELTAVNNVAFVVGDILYWDDSANKLTKTATGNTRCGVCAAAKATATTTGRVRLNAY